MYHILAGNLLLASIDLSAGGGVMVQPSSQYFHYVYGSAVTISADQSDFVVRAQMWQRPEFTSSGFQDQDEGAQILLGHRFKNLGVFEFYMYLGGGLAQGYIQDLSSQTKSSYKVYGTSSSASLGYHIGRFSITLEHLMFIGRRNQIEIDAKVLWPFSVTWINLGWVV